MKCKNCKSKKLSYKEDFKIIKIRWWQWLLSLIGSIIATIYVPIIGIPAIIAVLVTGLRKKKKIYTYTCQDCGYKGNA